MQPGDADVVQPRHVVAHQLRRARRLFGHRQVRRAGGGDDDRAFAGRDVLLAETDDGGIRVKRGRRHFVANGLERLGARARDEQRRAASDNLGGDGRDLRRRLAQAEDDFREPLADGPVMIDAREPQILVRAGAQLVHQPGVRRGRIDLAARHLFEQILQLFV